MPEENKRAWRQEIFDKRMLLIVDGFCLSLEKTRKFTEESNLSDWSRNTLAITSKHIAWVKANWPKSSVRDIFFCILSDDGLKVFGTREIPLDAEYLPSREAMDGDRKVGAIINLATKAGFESEICPVRTFKANENGYWLTLRKQESAEKRLQSIIHLLMPYHWYKEQYDLSLLKPNPMQKAQQQIGLCVYNAYKDYERSKNKNRLNYNLTNIKHQLKLAGEKFSDKKFQLLISKAYGRVDSLYETTILPDFR